MVLWLKGLLFVAGGMTAAAGAAYVTGMLDPWLQPPPAAIASLPETPAEQKPQEEAQEEAPAASEQASLPDDPATTGKQPRLSAPAFDVVRVEPDGSVLVAGKAPAGATVELLSGETVLGTASADASGNFVIVLDDTLPGGDYVLSLRAVTTGGDASASTETAIVSIPETEDGQVLVMVEEPGAPAQILTAPEAPATDGEPAAAEEEQEPEVAAAPETGQAAEPAQEQVAEEPAAEEEQVATAPETDEPAAAPEEEAAAEEPAAEEEQAAAAAPQEQEEAAPQPAAVSVVSVEAVEIEGGTVFVAGRADPGRTVRVYANALLLGEARASENGRFLVEARRELPVGAYVIRADLISDDGAVLARAAVPFEREPGEAIAAVAAPPAAETTQQQPAPEAEAAPDEPAQEEVAVAAAPPAAEVDDVEITQPPLQRADKSVIIRRGDNLWRISRRVYGKGVRYSTIYLANKEQISDPDRIWPGQVFTVPRATAEGEEAEYEGIAGQVVPSEEEAAAQ